MCKFCENNGSELGGGFEIYQENGNWILGHDCVGLDQHPFIKFCPMCGAKLPQVYDVALDVVHTIHYNITADNSQAAVAKAVKIAKRLSAMGDGVASIWTNGHTIGEWADVSDGKDA